jgi:hypothetical protein
MFGPPDPAGEEEGGAPAWIPWDLALEKTAGSDLAAAYPSFSEGGDTSEEENYGLAEEDQERLLLHLLQVGAQGAGAAAAASTPGRSSGGWPLGKEQLLLHLLQVGEKASL